MIQSLRKMCGVPLAQGCFAEDQLSLLPCSHPWHNRNHTVQYFPTASQEWNGMGHFPRHCRWKLIKRISSKSPTSCWSFYSFLFLSSSRKWLGECAQPPLPHPWSFVCPSSRKGLKPTAFSFSWSASLCRLKCTRETRWAHQISTLRSPPAFRKGYI